MAPVQSRPEKSSPAGASSRTRSRSPKGIVVNPPVSSVGSGSSSGASGTSSSSTDVIVVDETVSLTPMASNRDYTLYRLVYPDDSQDGTYDPRLEAYLNSLVNSMKHSRGGPSFSDAEIAARVARARREYLAMQRGECVSESESEADSEETLELPGYGLENQ
eukprot:s494_g12.t1